MRHLLGILLVLAVLGEVVPGCGGGRERVYDGRLAAADSLLRDEPDSALAIITALPTDCLATEHDRAYRDLLLTQARYRAYVTATSDSDINRAVAYFADCRPIDREKLTRAYIYKGAVMDELGHPDSAMLYYKHAEATAAPDDYFNLGYVNLRMGEIYQSQLSNSTASIKILKKSLSYFELLKDTSYLIVVNGAIGSINGFNDSDSCKYYLKQAIALAREYNSPLQYTYKSKLAGLFFNEQDYPVANELAMDVFNNGRFESYDNQFYYYAAYSFIKLNREDSAIDILNNTPQPVSSVDSMNRYDLLAELARAENDNESYGRYIALSREISSRLIVSSKEHAISKTEMTFEMGQLEKENSNTLFRNKVLQFLVALAIGLIMLLAIKYTRSRQEKTRITLSLEQEIEKLKLEQREKSNSVSSLVKYRIDALNELYQSIRIKSRDENKTKRVVPLSSLFKSMNDNNEILEICLPDSFWEKIKLSVDGEYPGIISFVEERYPSLSKQDLQLFYLLCAKVSPQIIKLCMNYMNAKTVSNYKKKLIRDKMGMDMSFDDFLLHYRNGKLS